MRFTVNIGAAQSHHCHHRENRRDFTGPKLAVDRPPHAVAQQVHTYLDAIRSSRGRYKPLLLATSLAFVIGATTVGQLQLNAWNEPFFNAIKNKDLPTFGFELIVFIIIASFVIVLNVLQTWLDQLMKISLREWISRDLLIQWLAPKRAFLLANAGPIGSNPDQRIQEDTRRLTELTASLAIGFFQSTLLLLSFIGVLWLLSHGFVFHVAGRSFEIPGFMVWSALIYAVSGSWLSWRLSRPLMQLDAAICSRSGFSLWAHASKLIERRHRVVWWRRG
jgi:putative ATP-binding cassette transporter